MILKFAVERVTLLHILQCWVQVLAWEPAILNETVSGFPHSPRQLVGYCLGLVPLPLQFIFFKTVN
jgi:hypothetical protein